MKWIHRASSSKIFLIFILIYSQGCSNVTNEVSHYPETNQDFSNNIQELFSVELGKEQNLELGLALSGGGIRSASFSIGALEGLHHSGLLDKVDVMSTVSGGGYAGYWFMNSMYELDKSFNFQANRGDLFNDCFPDFPNYCPYIPNNAAQTLECTGKAGEQRRTLSREGCSNRRNNKYKHQFMIAQQIDLLIGFTDETKLGRLSKWGDIGLKVTSLLPSLIPHHIGNTIFDWDINTSPIRHYYQNGIERTYGSVPENIEDDGINTYYNQYELTFEQLRKYTEKSWQLCSKSERNKGNCRRMPLWIINSTAGVGSNVFDMLEEKGTLLDTVFWLTPFSYGSDEYGYIKETISEITVPKAISISGAALDSQANLSSGVGRVGLNTLLHATNLNLGYSINNYNPNSSNRTFHAFLPWPFYYAHGFKEDKESTDIYLSDGGHSENLGIYSLIMRGVKNIIAVDAEQDEKGTFSSLINLRDALKLEHKILLLGDNGEDLEEFINIDSYKPHNAPKSIFKLKAINLPKGLISDVPSKNFISIIYIKSSIEVKKMSDDWCDIQPVFYPCTVAAFYRINNFDSNGKPIMDQTVFPHHPTGFNEIESSASIYYAYRDLAKHISQRITFDDKQFTIIDQ